jgi:hypothetical protein
MADAGRRQREHGRDDRDDGKDDADRSHVDTVARPGLTGDRPSVNCGQLKELWKSW